MHHFPFNPKIRAQWVKFVKCHRVDFGEPINKYASLCLAHFEPSFYPIWLWLSLQGTEETKHNKAIIKGSISTRDTVLPAIKQEPTDCGKRQVSRFVYSVVLLKFYVASNKLDIVSNLKETFVKYLDWWEYIETWACLFSEWYALLNFEVTVLSWCRQIIISLCSGRSIAASAWKDSCASFYHYWFIWETESGGEAKRNEKNWESQGETDSEATDNSDEEIVDDGCQRDVR